MTRNIKLYLGVVFALYALSCKKAEFGDAVVLVTGTEVNPIVKFAVENTPSEYSVTATTSYRATEDMQVSFALDTALVAGYNKEHNTTYYAVPLGAVDITNLETVIKAGSSTSTPVSVKVISTSPLVDGRSYLIPLTIKSVSGGGMNVLESGRTVFLRIARIISFPALSMNNAQGATTGAPGTRGRFNATYLFNAATAVRLPNFTFEIKNMVYDFRGGDGNSNPQPIQTLMSWSDQAEATSIGLRYGELGNPNNSLQLIGALGSAFAYNFSANQWYTISLAYDGAKLVMYVDGNKVAEKTGSAVMEFSRLTFGQMWGGYDTRQYFNGRIAECRVWTRALTASEIKLNLCGADPNADGLLAYWKLNEGAGAVFKNSSKEGAKYDMDWSKAYWDFAGSGTLVQADKSSFVTWTSDALNKCSQ